MGLKGDRLKALLPLVPTGEANAVPARLIWEALGRVGTIGTLKTKLNEMAKAGVIEKRQCSQQHRERHELIF